MGEWFDTLARAWAGGRSRRAVLRAVGVGFLGLLAGAKDVAAAPGHCKSKGVACNTNVDCCALNCCNQICCGEEQACSNGQCTSAPQPHACGGAGQACCDGTACNAGLTCASGTCHTLVCGGAGQACCNETACNAGLTCTNGTCQAPAIGGAGQASSISTASNDLTNRVVVLAGEPGQPCCNGTACNNGLSCTGGTCQSTTTTTPPTTTTTTTTTTAPPCGGSGQPCCAGGTACTNGGCCSGGTCVAGTSNSACGSSGGTCSNCAVSINGSSCLARVCSCSSDADCPSGRFCQFGSPNICQPCKPTSSACTANNECCSNSCPFTHFCV